MTNREKLIKEIVDKADDATLVHAYLSSIQYECEDCVAEFDCAGTSNDEGCYGVLHRWMQKGEK